MHHRGAYGQFPRQALDDVVAARCTDALDARRQLSDPGPKPPKRIEGRPRQLPGPKH